MTESETKSWITNNQIANFLSSHERWARLTRDLIIIIWLLHVISSVRERIRKVTSMILTWLLGTFCWFFIFDYEYNINAQVFQHQMTMSYRMSIRDTSCLVLLALPYPNLLRGALKTVTSQATSRISQKPLQQRKSITVYCSRSDIFLFILD